jgi:hypothetical protein
MTDSIFLPDIGPAQQKPHKSHGLPTLHRVHLAAHLDCRVTVTVPARSF